MGKSMWKNCSISRRLFWTKRQLAHFYEVHSHKMKKESGTMRQRGRKAVTGRRIRVDSRRRRQPVGHGEGFLLATLLQSVLCAMMLALAFAASPVLGPDRNQKLLCGGAFAGNRGGRGICRGAAGAGFPAGWPSAGLDLRDDRRRAGPRRTFGAGREGRSAPRRRR